MCKVTGALSSLIVFHHGPTAAKLSSLRMLETVPFIIIERAQAHEAHSQQTPSACLLSRWEVPVYEPTSSTRSLEMVGGWCEAEEKKRRRRGRREEYLYWTGR